MPRRPVKKKGAQIIVRICRNSTIEYVREYVEALQHEMSERDAQNTRLQMYEEGSRVVGNNWCCSTPIDDSFEWMFFPSH